MVIITSIVEEKDEQITNAKLLNHKKDSVVSYVCGEVVKSAQSDTLRLSKKTKVTGLFNRPYFHHLSF